jgi:hypothetical protein
MAGLDKVLYGLARRWTVPRLSVSDLEGLVTSMRMPLGGWVRCSVGRRTSSQATTGVTVTMGAPGIRRFSRWRLHWLLVTQTLL